MASLIKPFTQTFSPANVPSLANKCFLVTGGTNGIGLSLARSLYSHRASVYIISSQKEVADAAISYIRSGELSEAPDDYAKGFGSVKDASADGAEGDGKVEWVQCDLSDLNAVARAGKDLQNKLDRLDGFVGIAGKGVNEFKLTKDGYDSHLTINNLSHHVLLSHLFPLLQKTSKLPGADVRIVQMSSELHRAKTYDGKFASVDEFKQDVGPNNLYARSKLAVILFTKALIQRHIERAGSSILAYSTHPGAIATGQQDQFKPAYGEVLGGVLGAVVRPFMATPQQGAVSILWASVGPDARDADKYPNGSYFTGERELGGETNEGQDQELIDNFYENSEKVIQDVTGGKGLGSWD